MAAVVRNLDTLSFDPTPSGCAAAPQGDVRTAAVLHSSKRPLFLWMHDMAPGSSLTWANPAQDHTFYVWEGRISTEDGDLGANEVHIIEHGAEGTISTTEGAKILQFHRPEESPKPALRAGGHRHAISRDSMLSGGSPGIKHYLWADAECPHCEVWLHGHDLPPSLITAQHYHNEDEIIVVRGGEMKLGRQTFGRGGVLAVDANTHYAFEAGESGVSFINFRIGHPFHMLSDASRPPMDELTQLRGLLGLQDASHANARAAS